ncbi:MAG: MlaD family protein, partial [Planctomycetota bacterium]
MNGGHFKLGLFVTVAVTLLVVFLLTLGVLDRFRPQVDAETYFVESIQNLQTGAPVRFRGVTVGTVHWIGFAATQYEQAAQAMSMGSYGSYIMVRLKLFSEPLAQVGVSDVRGALASGVERGLRARLGSSGLGGPTHIEVDYVDPAEFPPPPIGWTPQHIYIPSAPSAVVSIVDSLVLILRRVDELSLIEELSMVAHDLQRVLEEVQSSGL